MWNTGRENPDLRPYRELDIEEQGFWGPGCGDPQADGHRRQTWASLYAACVRFASDIIGRITPGPKIIWCLSWLRVLLWSFWSPWRHYKKILEELPQRISTTFRERFIAVKTRHFPDTFGRWDEFGQKLYPHHSTFIKQGHLHFVLVCWVYLYSWHSVGKNINIQFRKTKFNSSNKNVRISKKEEEEGGGEEEKKESNHFIHF